MTTLLLTTVTIQATDSRIFPPFRSQSAYVLKLPDIGTNVNMYAERKSDGARFMAHVSIHNKVRSSTNDYVTQKLRTSAVPRPPNHRETPSRFPAKYFSIAGRRWYQENWVGNRYSAMFADDHAAAEVKVTAPMDTEVRTVGTVTGVVTNRIREIDMTYAVPDMEQLGRFSLSAYLGDLAKPAQPTAFSGTSLTTKVSAYSDTKFVRLESAAKAAGWTIAKGEHSITAQLTKSGRQALIFVAAADSYKKGSTWIGLPDVPLIVDDELWIPTTILPTLAN